MAVKLLAPPVNKVVQPLAICVGLDWHRNFNIPILCGCLIREDGVQNDGIIFIDGIGGGIPLSLMRYAKLEPETSSRDLIRQILEAAVYVHARGTPHQDLKPDNVMVSRDRDGNLLCRVTDFGDASNRMLDATPDSAGRGDWYASYMAPEQAQGLPSIGPSVDLYAIGVMLYELLSGRLPLLEGCGHCYTVRRRKNPQLFPMPICWTLAWCSW